MIHLNQDSMERMQKKILNYLRENFGKKLFLEVKNLNEKNADVYGFNSIQILIKNEGNIIKYQPIFNNYKVVTK